jgi:hypothetical protein
LEIEAVPVRERCIFVRLDMPTYANLAVGADELRIRVRDVASGDWGDGDAFPAWFGGRETADVGVDPGADRAEGVVVCGGC